MISPADEVATALMEAFLERRESLHALFRARTGSPSEADDLVQDLFVKLTAINERTIDHPHAYLYRLALNLLIDRQRKGARMARRDQAWGELSLHPVGETFTDDTPSPEHVIDYRIRLSRLAAALGRLPSKTQEVFRLHKLDGHSYAEVAQRLGVSKSAVEKHMMRALKQLLDAGLRDD